MIWVVCYIVRSILVKFQSHFFLLKHNTQKSSFAIFYHDYNYRIALLRSFCIIDITSLQSWYANQRAIIFDERLDCIDVNRNIDSLLVAVVVAIIKEEEVEVEVEGNDDPLIFLLVDDDDINLTFSCINKSRLICRLRCS